MAYLGLSDLVAELGSEGGLRTVTERDKWYHARRGIVDRGVEAFVNGVQRSFVDLSPRNHPFVQYLDGVYKDTKIPYHAGVLSARLAQGAVVLYVLQHMLPGLSR
ncbi:MAG: hypothetical protein ABIA93_03265 [Candidatus Woesearchaeota archaeon]